MAKLLLTTVFLMALAGCGTTQGVFPAASGSGINSAVLVNTDVRSLQTLYDSGSLGVLQLYRSLQIRGVSNISIYGPGALNGQADARFDIGSIAAGQKIALYLPPGKYLIQAGSADGSLSTPIEVQLEPRRARSFALRDRGRPPAEDSGISSVFNEGARGSIYDLKRITDIVVEQSRKAPPQFSVSSRVISDSEAVVEVKLDNPLALSDVVVNGSSTPVSSNWPVVSVRQQVSPGENHVVVAVVGKNGLTREQKHTVRVMNEAEKAAAQKERARIAAEAIEAERVKAQIAEEEAMRKRLEQERVAREGDGSQDDLLCKKYGLRPMTDAYGQCRIKLDLAKQESRRQAEQYERERLEYERRLAAIERENERRKALNQIELGFRLLGGQNPVDAVNSVGTGAPIAPRPPAPVFHNITLPNGNLVTCTTNGAFTNCN